jgi:hypothetical protein
MGFKDDVEKHMEKKYPETHPPKKEIPARKTFAIHIPEQTLYTTSNTMEDAEEIAVYEYANLHDLITEVKETDIK